MQELRFFFKVIIIIFKRNTSEQHTAADLVNLLLFLDSFLLIMQISSGSLNKMVKRNLFYTLFTKCKSIVPARLCTVKNTYTTVGAGYN